MKRLRLTEALGLAPTPTKPAISIYLATNIRGENSQKTIRENLQRLYKSVEAKIQWRFRSLDGIKSLSSLRLALNKIRPERSRGGLAIFHSDGFTGVLKLPTPIKDLAVAADSFHFKPVLKAQQLRRSYYLLAFGKDSAVFYKVTPDAVHRLHKSDYNTYHYAIAEGPPSSMYKVSQRRKIAGWMGQLRHTIDRHCDAERLPLLLAGPKDKLNMFRKKCAYPYLLESGIAGDPSKQSEKRLFHISSLFMECYFSTYQKHNLDSFVHAKSLGATSSCIATIAKAAAGDELRHLFVAEDRHIWGSLNRRTGEIKLVTEQENHGNDDLLDDLAELSLRYRASVTVLPTHMMPDGQPIAAILKSRPQQATMTKPLRAYIPPPTAPNLGHSISLLA